IKNILAGLDPRKLAIIGPCSIHDPKAAIEYAKLLNNLHLRLQDKLYIVIRVYFEKPRTVIGWKGLINDPDLDGSCNMPKGLFLARKLLLDLVDLKIPTATEILDPISPQYIGDLLSWASIGARTTESQTHREMASGFSMPVGFKNSTDGSFEAAVSALEAAKNPHSFIGIDNEGNTAIVRTKGNPWGHIILRGGKTPNYEPIFVEKAILKLKEKNLLASIMIDCSHANSNKKPENQAFVMKNIIEQINKGNKNIIGFMLESNLNAGSQKIPPDLNQLKYGVSVTDACISWQETEQIMQNFYDSLPNL
ncbi:MAG: 3-deoxy-7-phosphoheptulonate synthase, partial [Candidatus Margulisiibacteriota bacterium]